MTVIATAEGVGVTSGAVSKSQIRKIPIFGLVRGVRLIPLAKHEAKGKRQEVAVVWRGRRPDIYALLLHIFAQLDRLGVKLAEVIRIKFHPQFGFERAIDAGAVII